MNIPHIDISSRKDFDTIPEKIYYMSYGSNLAMERFMCYIAGGTPLGSTKVYKGCRNKTSPVKSVGITFTGQAFFAGHSSQWGGGGVLFIDFNIDTVSMGRMHLITREQFEDVVSQECGGEAGEKHIDFETLFANGTITDTGLYGHVVYVGTYEGIPVISFTTSDTLEEVASNNISLQFNHPTYNYANVIGGGLVETFGFTYSDVAEYFDTIVGFYSDSSVKATLEKNV